MKKQDINFILEKQRYNYNVKTILEITDCEESRIFGLIKIYFLGIITGKRMERSKGRRN